MLAEKYKEEGSPGAGDVVVAVREKRATIVGIYDKYASRNVRRRDQPLAFIGHVLHSSFQLLMFP
jgi:hypothetical protein